MTGKGQRPGSQSAELDQTWRSHLLSRILLSSVGRPQTPKQPNTLSFSQFLPQGWWCSVNYFYLFSKVVDPGAMWAKFWLCVRSVHRFSRSALLKKKMEHLPSLIWWIPSALGHTYATRRTRIRYVDLTPYSELAHPLPVFWRDSCLLCRSISIFSVYIVFHSKALPVAGLLVMAKGCICRSCGPRVPAIFRYCTVHKHWNSALWTHLWRRFRQYWWNKYVAFSFRKSKRFCVLFGR